MTAGGEDPARLEVLVELLHASGLPVGPADVLRLQHVLALGQDELDAGVLRSVLAALLVRSEPEAEALARSFESWEERCQRMRPARKPELNERLLSQPPRPAPPRKSALPPSSPQGEKPAHTPSRPRRSRRWAVLFAAAVAIAVTVTVAVLVARWRVPERPAKAGPGSDPVAPPPPAPQPAPDEAPLAERFTVLVPVFEVSPGGARQAWPGVLLCGTAIAGALAALVGLRRRSRPPDDTAIPCQSGGRFAALLGEPPAAQGARRTRLVLEARDEEQMVWGMERFTAEEASEQLDIAATVRATVDAGGVIVPVFERLLHDRELWLWTDEETLDAGGLWPLEALAHDLEAALSEAGLCVERASFWGVPDELQAPRERPFAPAEVADRRQLAVVLVLTDGAGLLAALAEPYRAHTVEALLRELALWPKLCFVDFSHGGRLAAALSAYGLEVVGMEDVPRFLAGSLYHREDQPRRARPLDPRVLDWAAACALAPFPIDAPTAMRLAKDLKLAPPAHGVMSLYALAEHPSGPLSFTAAARARQLARLWGVGAGDTVDREAHAHALRASAFWRSHLERIEASEQRLDRARPEAQRRWSESRAARHLQLQRALVDLWEEPRAGDAIARLDRLWRMDLRAEVERHLAGLRTLDTGGAANAAVLPWRLRDRSVREQQLLLRMGLGGMARTGVGRDQQTPVAVAAPRMSPRQRALFGALAGLALAGAAGAVTAPRGGGAGPPQIEPVDLPPDAWLATPVVAEGGAYRVAALTPRIARDKIVPAGSRVAVRWLKETLPCREKEEHDVEIWRCGHFAELQRPGREPEWPRRSIAVLAYTASEPGARRLAADLLDSGSADVVLLGEGVLRAVAKWQLGQNEPEQALLVGPTRDLTLDPLHMPRPLLWARLAISDDVASLGQSLRDFFGIRKLREVWPAAAWIEGSARAALLSGLADRGEPRLGERHALTVNESEVGAGMEFVYLKSGTYRMGSPAGEPNPFSDERPDHDETVTGFWIARTETTHAQYRRLVKDHSGDDQLPVANVDWHDAQRFCAAIGGRLPTEAEWEYAARAGTTTAYSFGDDPAQLGEYAWFDGNSGNAHPVAQKRANPWGLFDMHGNVREWTASCFSRYEPAAQRTTNVVADSSDQCVRVVRGGSFGWPRLLRSAYRSRGWPGFRDRLIGFRCVRGPLRQP